jgi:molybdate transport system ATP-binding protein
MRAMKILNAKLKNLTIDQFIAKPKEAWCLVGTNNSGIDDFFSLLEQTNKIDAQLIELPQNLGIVSFSSQQALFEKELKNDDTDFMDKIDPGTPACSFLKNPEEHADLIHAFGMTASLDKGYRQLSTGQARKLMILAQITKGVCFLAVQTPYEGLDPDSCQEVDKALALLHQKGIGILISIHNSSDIPNWCTHVGMISNGRLDIMGNREDKTLKKNWLKGDPDFKASVKDIIREQKLTQTDKRAQSSQDTQKMGKSKLPTELVRLKGGFAGYGGKPIFQGLDLTIRTGEHTLVTGPNGCGKSTLLQLITGDHPSCYQNDLHIFDIKRGSGESIWELKKQMGIVSPELHRNYYVPGSTLQAVISGLFDSIGLYRDYTPKDEEKAKRWLARTGLALEAATPFRQLSYANQRLVLIARALIKLPRLLVLDEPTQGLDELNRNAVLDFLEQVTKENLSTILYVSHRKDEYRPFFKCRLKL